MLNQNLKEMYWKQCELDNWFSFDALPFSYLCSFSKGEFICFEGEPIPSLYFLVEGRTKAFTTHSDGHISLIEYNSPLSIIGEMELIGTREHVIAVQAMEPCICISFSFNLCHEKLLTDSAFLLQLSRYLSIRVRRNTQNFVSMQAHPLEQRLCTFILSVSVDGCFSERLTETAEYLGSSYRHMQRIVENLCHKQVLTRTRKGYMINDFSYLEEHSLPDTTL